MYILSILCFKVNPLREKLCENADLWDRDDPLLANLENLLGKVIDTNNM